MSKEMEERVELKPRDYLRFIKETEKLIRAVDTFHREVSRPPLLLVGADTDNLRNALVELRAYRDFLYELLKFRLLKDFLEKEGK